MGTWSATELGGLTPSTAYALRAWPEPSCLEVLASFRAYANWVRDYIPGYLEIDKKLRPYGKKGAPFQSYFKDEAAKTSFRQLKDAVTSSAALFSFDHDAARDPESGRPFELYVDAADYGWGLPRALDWYARCTLERRSGHTVCRKW